MKMDDGSHDCMKMRNGSYDCVKMRNDISAFILLCFHLFKPVQTYFGKVISFKTFNFLLLLQMLQTTQPSAQMEPYSSEMTSHFIAQPPAPQYHVTTPNQ